MSPVAREVPLDRRVPRWAAALVARLAQDRPSTLTRGDIAGYLDGIGSSREIDTTVRDLVRLGWLVSSHLHGVWSFVPPGESVIVDPYLDLRAWRAKDPDLVYALAGEAAAWHLGYLDRRFDGPVSIWLPQGVRPPPGIRPFVKVLALDWGQAAEGDLGPSRALLRRRRLDLTAWANGVHAFGPEALLVQLAARPASFLPWADLVAHLGNLADDCEPDRLRALLADQSASAWQRAAYLLHIGGSTQHARDVLAARPFGRLVHASLGSRPRGEHSREFGVTDHLVAPLLSRIGKG